MRIIGIATLVAASAIGFSAFAADAPQKPQSSSTAKVDDLDRIICKGEADTGTRLPAKKKCLTKRQWNDIAEQTRQNLDADATHRFQPEQH